ESGSKEFGALMDQLRVLGSPRAERVNSYAVSETPEEIIDYFKPWIAGTKRTVAPGLTEQFRSIVLSRYCIRSDLYVFPTEHLFVSCRKEQECSSRKFVGSA